MSPKAKQTKQAAAAPTDVQWVKCPSCDAFVYTKRLTRNLKVCPECNHHMRLKVHERLAHILDEGSFDDLTDGVGSIDVLGFVDAKPYPKRLEEARAKTGRPDAALFGTGTVDGHPLVVAAMDFAFMGGAWARASARPSPGPPSWRSRRAHPAARRSPPPAARGCRRAASR